MKKTITEVETAIENRIAELEEEYELDIYDRNDIREEEYQKAGWRRFSLLSLLSRGNIQ